MFFLRQRERTPADGEGIGPVTVESVCKRVSDADLAPVSWSIQDVALPLSGFPVRYGASLSRIGGWIYSYVIDGANDDNDISMVRWDETEFLAGDLQNPQWWNVSSGWTPTSLLNGAPDLVALDGASEFSATFMPARGEHIIVQTHHFQDRRIAIRRAQFMEGPWSECLIAYAPPELARGDAAVFGAKAHAHLLGGDLIISYDSAALSLAQELGDLSLGYPRFIRLEFKD